MCYSGDYRRNSRNVALFQIILSISATIISIYLIGIWRKGSSDLTAVVGGILLISMLCSTFPLILLCGVKKENLWLCRIWYYPSLGSVGLLLLLICYLMLTNPTTDIFIVVGILMIQLCFVVIVKIYMYELQEKTKAQKDSQIVHDKYLENDISNYI